MAETYQFRHTYQFKAMVKPDIVAAEIRRIAQGGDLTAARVIEEATPDNAALHPCFEWNNSIAGHQYRLIQGRNLIRALVVQRDGDAGGMDTLYVHVPDSEQQEGKYIRLTSLVDDIGEYERALIEAQRDLDAAERRFMELRRLVEKRGDRAEALAIAIQGFSAVKGALALLKG